MENKNLWAPWRINYIQKPKPADGTGGCFICDSLNNTNADDDLNLVLWKTDHAIVILNRYPYNNGHLLICPKKHVSQLDQLNDEEMLEIFKLISQSQSILEKTIAPQGFNVGINLGRSAGAGLPGHLHIHVVPRWTGDTNFINVCSDTDIISQSLTELLTILKAETAKNQLPKL